MRSMPASLAARIVCSAALLALALGVSGCCCFGGDWAQFAPPTTDDAGAQAEARRYYAEQVEPLLAQLTEDTGPGSGCGGSMLRTLATQAVVTVITRGHSGADSGAQVSVDPGACFARLVVLVVLTAGVWHGVAIVADTLDGRHVSLGSDEGYLIQVDIENGDSNSGSDEMF